MIFSMLSPNPARRPQSVIELFEAHEFMRPQSYDLNEDEARMQI